MPHARADLSMIAAAVSFLAPSYAAQYSFAAWSSVSKVMVFRHREPLHAAPCLSRNDWTSASLIALALKNWPSEMMSPGLKSYCCVSFSWRASASCTSRRHWMTRTVPTTSATTHAAATTVTSTAATRCANPARFHQRAGLSGYLRLRGRLPGRRLRLPPDTPRPATITFALPRGLAGLRRCVVAIATPAPS